MKILKKLLGKVLCYINETIEKIRIREKRVSYGNDYPDKTFFVIRRRSDDVGLFSYVSTALGWIRYAVDNGWIPIVDMENYKNPYIDDAQLHKVNAWELYFEQPCGFSLNDIKNSKNIILSNMMVPPSYPSQDMFENGKLELWRDLYKKYIRINNTIQNEVEKDMQYLFSGNIENIVGVNIRGTDYTLTKPKGHPIQPSVEEALLITKKCMKDWGCEKVFLITEDQSIIDAFSETLSDSIILPNAMAYDYRREHHTRITQNSFQRENDSYLKGKEYLVKVVIMSRLSNVICSYMGATYGLYMMTEGFENEYRWDLGVY